VGSDKESGGGEESATHGYRITNQDAGYVHTAGIDPQVSELVQAAIVWVSAGVGSGVLGNAAYDGIKDALRRITRWRRRSAVYLERSDTIVQYDAITLARVAVDKRLRHFGLDRLSDSDINHVSADKLSVGGWAVSFSGPQVYINVKAGAYECERRGVEMEVTIWNHPEIDKVRRKERRGKRTRSR
jgi:hypothetical protein